MMEIFHQSAVANAIYLGGGGSISDRDASRINKLIHKAGTIIAQNLEAFERQEVTE